MLRSHDTRQKLLAVAFDLIWDSSYGSVSVDDICRRAGVNKGSFYHFFPSKADLAVAAYQARWEAVKPIFDELFSAEVPPLDRIRAWCRHVYRIQREQAEKFGHVCGCPYASVGAELATQDEKIRASSEGLIYAGRKYVQQAIAEAMRAGELPAGNAALAARRAYGVCLGMLFEARVQNSLAPLKDLEPAILSLLGVGKTSASTRGTSRRPRRERLKAIAK
jgi:TetR/AcrR family transcriptional repressor of nem operon